MTDIPNFGDIKKKTISNLRFSFTNYYLNNDYIYDFKNCYKINATNPVARLSPE
jgi:hypothetical protein